MVHVWSSVSGLICAYTQVGSRVFITQGPPIEAQLAVEPNRTPLCVGLEVEKNVWFASMQIRKRETDDRQQRRDDAELDEV